MRRHDIQKFISFDYMKPFHHDVQTPFMLLQIVLAYAFWKKREADKISPRKSNVDSRTEINLNDDLEPACDCVPLSIRNLDVDKVKVFVVFDSETEHYCYGLKKTESDPCSFYDVWTFLMDVEIDVLKYFQGIRITSNDEIHFIFGETPSPDMPNSLNIKGSEDE